MYGCICNTSTQHDSKYNLEGHIMIKDGQRNIVSLIIDFN